MTQTQRTSGYYLRSQITIDILILKQTMELSFCNTVYRPILADVGIYGNISLFF